MSDKNDATKTPSTDDLKLKLTPMQFHVTQEAGTERPFTGEYWDTKEPGTYHCVVCGHRVVRLGDQVRRPTAAGRASTRRSTTAGSSTSRTAPTAWSAPRCAAPTAAPTSGTSSPTAPPPTGDRYCINSASLNLERRPATSTS